MFWLISGLMLAAAILVVAWPLYRSEKRLSGTAVVAILIIAGLTGGLYSWIGAPHLDTSAGSDEMPDVEEMVSSLATRLSENPNDLAGWKMLGRSYLQMRNFPGAIEAFEHAVQMESSQDGQTLADLGEAVLMNDSSTMNGRAGQLFENALALEPGNPKALFYSGMAAVQRGDNELGAARWEALLATSPPPNVQEILRQRIAELRGEVPAEATPAPAPAGPVVTVDLSLGAAATSANLPDATIFVIARDPNQPAPPIAAVRRRLSELPASVPIGDSDAMIPGRVPSGFTTLEIIARVSLTGQPTAQPGDWYGQQTIDTSSTSTIDLVIDQQVP
jgi:cytochrome c-type biogenesis protein CcmH